jgi:3-oxoacyl-[acyl-carrier-protein] synthase-1
LEALLLPAIEQALAPIEEAGNASRVALVLALPSRRPGRPDDLEKVLRSRVARRWPGRFTAVATFAVGHAGGFLGTQAAWRKIAEGAFDTCVIAGVDSYAAPQTLEWLETTEQLHGAGPLNNAWGFIPGEAAGAILLVSEHVIPRLAVESLAQLLSVGTAIEQNRINTETVCIGQGLTAAFRAGLAGLPAGACVTDVICDMNGEPYRADEFGFAAVRVKESFMAASDFVAPADCWGDVGAASMPLSVILATIAGWKSYAKGPHAFVWASSESGERGASLFYVPVREHE